MKIAVVSGFAPLWGTDMPPDILMKKSGKSVGGGEEAMVRTAVELAGRNHEVTLYWCGLPGDWRGVTFKSTYDPLAPALLRESPDVILSWSTILPFQWASPTARCLFAQQLNDCWAPGDWGRVNCVVSPSRNHAAQLPSWGWKGPWTVVHNGLDPELYQHAPAWDTRPLHVGYWSSPDRGLHHLLHAWPEVLKQEPTAHLHVFYEIDNWLNTGAARNLGAYGDRAREMLNESLPRAKGDPSITFHGNVPRIQLAETQVKCRVHCYPFQRIDYTEGFAGAVNCGIAAGCHVLTTPLDAFESLYSGAVTWLPVRVTEMEAELPHRIVSALRTPPPAGAEAARFKFTWTRAGEEMDRAVMGDWDCDKRGLHEIHS